MSNTSAISQLLIDLCDITLDDINDFVSYDQKRAKRAIKRGADVNHTVNVDYGYYSRSLNALRCAIRNNDDGFIDYLLSKGANINDGFFFASKLSNFDLAKKFADLGADVGHVVPDGTFGYVIAKDVDPNRGFLFACSKGDTDIALDFIHKGVDVDYVRPTDGMTALDHAISTGMVNVINFLIANGANINTLNGKARLLLFKACQNPKAGVVDALIRAGVDVNTKNSDGQTALFMMTNSQSLGGHPHVDHAISAIDSLVKAGIDTNSKDNRGLSALWYLYQGPVDDNFAKADRLASYCDKALIISVLNDYAQSSYYAQNDDVAY